MKGLARSPLPPRLPLAPAAAHADMKALEEAAKKEGELTWYVAHYTSEGAEELGAEFTKLYGIKVNVVRTTAQVAYQRLPQDLKNNQIDLRCLLLDRCRPLCAAEGRRQASRNTRRRTASKILPSLPQLRSRTATIHTTSAGLVVITYNTSKVKPEDAPKKWTDLLDSSGRTRSRPAIPASRAMSAPGW